MKLALALAAVLAFAATPLPDMTITSTSADIEPLTTFDHTYTVTNTGGSTGKYQTTDSFTTYFDIVAIPANCYIDTTLVRSVRRQVGVVCNGTLAPGESVTLTETLRWKGLPYTGYVVVNRNRNVQVESDYTNNAAPWSVR